MGGGGESQTQNNQQAIAQQQNQTAQQYLQLATNEFNRFTTLQQPAVDFYQNLVNAGNSGNYQELLTAAGPTTGEIAQAGQQSQAQIMNQLPPGAAQQYALAQNIRGTNNAQAANVNQLYTSAFPALAQLGTQAGNLGVAQSSAGISSQQGAANTYAQVGQEQAQAKASTLGFLGSLAGAGGEAASGGFFNSGGGGGSSVGGIPGFDTGFG